MVKKGRPGDFWSRREEETLSVERTNDGFEIGYGIKNPRGEALQGDGKQKVGEAEFTAGYSAEGRLSSLSTFRMDMKSYKKHLSGCYPRLGVNSKELRILRTSQKNKKDFTKVV